MEVAGGGDLPETLQAAQAGGKKQNVSFQFYSLTSTHPVQRQIPKMQQTLTDAENGDQAAIGRVTQAFGPDGVAKIPTIRANVNSLDSLRMQVSPNQPAGINANTPFDNRASASDPLHVGPVEFGENFHHVSATATDAVKEERKKQNIATVLHEATHYAPFHASDDYYKDTKQMIPLGLSHSVDPKDMKANGGCTYSFLRTHACAHHSYVCL